MMKEKMISIYLTLFKSCFMLFSLFPLQNKTVFVSSFGNNAYYVAQKLARSTKQPLIFLNKPKCKIDFSSIPTMNKKIYKFETLNLLDTCRSIYHLATAKYIFVDNYVAVLSVANFRQPVKCVQLWHATGAIKQFGWSEPSTKKRSEQAQKRFQQVYNRFQFIPVGSEQMAQIFAESFRLGHDRFLYTGVPQTDFYFDTDAKAKALKRVQKTYPEIINKKVVLYAPTFRKDLFHKTTVNDWINTILENLDDNTVMLIRLHPSVKGTAELPKRNRLLAVNDYPHINELLIATDILITDYSSISFEFSLLRKKMIFFLYDLNSYIQEQGLWAENALYFPGPIAKSTEELVDHLTDPTVDYEKIDRFREHWNTFSTGQATQKLISSIYEEKDF